MGGEEEPIERTDWWLKTYELQVLAGISDIGPMTFGELVHACQVKIDFECGNMAALMAQVRNATLTGHGRRFKADDFYRRQLHRTKRKGMPSVERLHGLFGAFDKKR